MAIELGALVRADLASIESRVAALGEPLKGMPAVDGAGKADALGSFAATLQGALQSVNGQDVAAGEKMAAVERGESDDLTGAMLASQEASLSFSMLMQVRNKVMGAFEELVKLPL